MKKSSHSWLVFCLLTVNLAVNATEDQSLHAAYQNAIKDAQMAEPHEISKELIAIVESNNRLMWKEYPDGKRVLVVTWTSWNGYDNQVGKAMELTRDIWVTTVPELSDFCKTHSLPKPSLRLEQLLGLPPKNGKNRFVEIWVNPNDLFRPSPDPEITDHEAELNFPNKGLFVRLEEEYIQWFNDLKSQSYGKDGYPWTRLGYTYDWGNPSSEIGLSEFVIRHGATVDIHFVSTNEEYCQSFPSIQAD